MPREVADAYLGDRAKPTTQRASHVLTDAEAGRIEGLYRNLARGTTVTIVRDQGGVRLERGPALIAMSSSRFVQARGASSPSTVTSADETWEFDGRGGARLTDEFGTVDTYERVPPRDTDERRAQSVDRQLHERRSRNDIHCGN